MSLLTFRSLLLFVIATKLEISFADSISTDIWLTETEINNETCPSCQWVDCFPAFEPGDCPENTIFQNNVIWGCCPACISYLDFGETCVFDDEVEKLVQTEELACPDAEVGLVCPETSEIRYLKNDPISNTQHKVSGFPLPTFKLFCCGPGYTCDDQISKKCTTIENSNLKCAQDQENYANWQEEQVPSVRYHFRPDFRQRECRH